jgi:hypothetical protein
VEVVPIFQELLHKAHGPSMVARSVLLNLAFFLTIGLAGYFSTYELTGQIVIDRAPIVPSDTDYLMVVGQLMVAIVLCVAYPINTLPIKGIVVTKLFKKGHHITSRQ